MDVQESKQPQITRSDHVRASDWTMKHTRSTLRRRAEVSFLSHAVMAEARLNVGRPSL